MGDSDAFDPLAIIRALNEQGVEYVVVGGFAVAAYGVIRATQDLDLVARLNWQNADRLASAMRAIGARDLDDSRSGVSRESLVRRVDRRLRTSHGDVHLLNAVAGVPRYEDLLPATIVMVGQERVAVAPLDELLAMKRISARPKDLIDVAELSELNEA